MHSKIYVGAHDLPEKNLDKMIRRLRLRGIEVVLRPNKFPYAYSTNYYKDLDILRAYMKELEKCESDEPK